MKFSGKIIFLIIFFIFIYLRLTPIINQTVPYTYDQGRDFLKVEEIIRYKNLTFIGPTTGIMGVFHGAWWYYLLSIPYVIFNGWPLGFYIFIFLLSLIANLLFFQFLKKEFNFLTALFFLSIISISPYFIPLSFFVSNNIVVPYLILIFIITLYRFFQKNELKYLIVSSLTAGFIFEFEVAFGMFLVPIFFLLVILFKESREKLKIKKNLFLFLSGFLIPFLPRILFEIKHNFLQTKIILNSITQPKLYNPKPLLQVLFDRIDLFLNYYKGIFFEYRVILAILVTFITFTALIKGYKNLKKNLKNTLAFIELLIFFLFALSLIYRDNFWVNYYEGIQYLFLFLITVGFYFLSKMKKINIIAYLTLFLFLAVNIYSATQEIFVKKEKKLIGLVNHTDTIKYIYKMVDKKDFCLRVYTPPVVPYTYNYLLSYFSRTKGEKYPKTDFVNDKCWYVIDDDDYKFRVEEWRKNNTPSNATLVEKKQEVNKTLIELWKI